MKKLSLNAGLWEWFWWGEKRSKNRDVESEGLSRRMVAKSWTSWSAHVLFQDTMTCSCRCILNIDRLEQHVRRKFAVDQWCAKMWMQLDFQLTYAHVAPMLCSLQRCDGRAVQGVWLKRLSLPAKRVFSSWYPGVGSNPTRTTFYGSLLQFHPYVNASSGRNRSWIICCRLLVFTSNYVHLTCVSVVIYLQG